MTAEMDLKTFVRESILQIISGVEEAIKILTAEEVGSGKINPIDTSKNYSAPKDVEFDIAITVSKENASGVGGGIKIAALQIGAKGEETLGSKAISRIKFAVPISLPSISGNEYKPSKFSGPKSAGSWAG